MAGGASFDVGVIGTPSGLSLAQVQVDSALNELRATAAQLTAIVQQQQQALVGFDFQDLPSAPGVNFNAQLDNWQRPTEPVLDYSLLEFREPDAPTVPSFPTDLPDVTGEKPPVSAELLSEGIDALLALIQARGLPEEWYRRNKERILSAVSEAEQVQVDAVSTEFARRGWTQPTGAESARAEVLRTEFAKQTGAAIRDYVIRALEIDSQILIQALGLIIQYFRAWVDLYDRETEIDIRVGDQTLRASGVRLQELEARLNIYRTRVDGEQARLGAVAQAYATETQQYVAQISEANAISGRDQAAAGIENQRSSLESNHVLQSHQQTLAERRRDIDEALNNLRLASDSITRIGQATYQALNVGASVGSRSSLSYGRSASASWSYGESRDLD